MTADGSGHLSLNLTISLHGVTKAFGPQRICTDLSLELSGNDRLAVTGRNGSGKSTFLRMLAGLLRPNAGEIVHRRDGKAVAPGTWYEHLSLVAPDFAVYDELTALENLRFFRSVGGWSCSDINLKNILSDLGLAGREYDLVRTFSSGMKQRVKYALALAKAPRLLLLDEPTVNLDETGTAIFNRVIERQRAQGICVIATNTAEEADLADRQISMGR